MAKQTLSTVSTVVAETQSNLHTLIRCAYDQRTTAYGTLVSEAVHAFNNDLPLDLQWQEPNREHGFVELPLEDIVGPLINVVIPAPSRDSLGSHSLALMRNMTYRNTELEELSETS